MILHPTRESEGLAAMIAAAAGLVAMPWSEVCYFGDLVPANWVGVSTIAEFRGLECEHVFVTGLEDFGDVPELRRLLYIALTRATYSATICALPPVHERLAALLAPIIRES